MGSNQLFPAAMQVDCPQPLCVGLGYLGFDTVMCFMCEHQWNPEEPGEAVPDVDVEEVMGLMVKRCPKCSQYIEKNGGCDHMKCRRRGCGYELLVIIEAVPYLRRLARTPLHFVQCSDSEQGVLWNMPCTAWEEEQKSLGWDQGSVPRADFSLSCLSLVSADTSALCCLHPV